MRKATFQQIVGVISFYLFTYFAPLWSWPITAAFLLFGNNLVRTFVVVYFINNIWGPGSEAPVTGSYPQPLRRLWIWKHAASYFPLTLTKTADLPTDKAYIFAFHPHGIFSVSAFISMGTEGAGFSNLFPGLRMHLMTLVMNFYCPLLREVLLLHGICNCSVAACRNLLSKGKGESICLIVGGAKESLATEPDTYDLVLGSRKGFVRMALETGADLVPVFAFGENNLFQISHFEPTSFVGRIQQWLLHSWGYTVPAIHGKGVLLSVGVLPYQKRIAVVVGAPISVPKFTGSLTSEEGRRTVDEVHARYMAALRGLWDAHKGKYAIGRKKTLQFIDNLPLPGSIPDSISPSSSAASLSSGSDSHESETS